MVTFCHRCAPCNAGKKTFADQNVKYESFGSARLPSVLISFVLTAQSEQWMHFASAARCFSNGIDKLFAYKRIFATGKMCWHSRLNYHAAQMLMLKLYLAYNVCFLSSIFGTLLREFAATFQIVFIENSLWEFNRIGENTNNQKSVI